MWLRTLLVCWLGLLLMPVAQGVWAGENSPEAELLFKGLSRQLAASQPGDQGSRARNAAWEDTAAYLQQSFGAGEEKPLTSSQADRAQGTGTWSTSVWRGSHSREIEAKWDRDQGKLQVTVKGEAGGAKLGSQKVAVGAYLIRIQADVVAAQDPKGNPILRTRLPKKGAVESFALGCDEGDQIDFSGRWTDNQGRQWLIKQQSPLTCTSPTASIIFERTSKFGYKIIHTGTISKWHIDVRHIITNANAIEELPLWVRQVIARGTKGIASWIISLSPQRQADGTMYLEGTYTGFKVTWDPGGKTVSDVFPSYQKHFVLSSVKVASAAPECPPEELQGWEKKKTETRERYKKRTEETREEYVNKIRNVYDSYGRDMERLPNLAETLKKARDSRVKQLEQEMEKELTYLSKWLEEELAKLDKAKQRCESTPFKIRGPKMWPAIIDIPTIPPPPSEKPGLCPDEVVQYWQNKIKEARAARQRDLDKLFQQKREEEKDALLNYEKGISSGEDTKIFLEFNRQRYQRNKDWIYEYYRDLIHDYEHSLKKCEKP
jgi:hypothetical protein